MRDDHPYEGSSRPRRRKWIFLLPVGLAIVVVLFGSRLLRENERAGYRTESGTLREDARREAGAEAVGTTGRDEPAASEGPSDSPALIREVEMITGTVDARELIGRKVNLHVPVQDRANDMAFWVGGRDNRLLVVPRRDTRDGVERQRGLPSESDLRFQPGDQAAITGSVQKTPRAEEMYSWGLTAADVKELTERGIYIRADDVSRSGNSEQERDSRTGGSL